MKDFPIFTTQFGVASLTLNQIPYNKMAYITIQDSTEPLQLLKECCDFCLAVGATSVFASGHSCLAMYSLHTAIVAMRCLRERLADTDAALFPVQEGSLERFREIYNDGMKDVTNAAYMSVAEGKKMLANGNGYFVHRDKELLGIGIAGGENIDVIVSLIPGQGTDVLLALNHALSGNCANVQVATANKRAVRFYEKLGFVKNRELSRWYKIV